MAASTIRDENVTETQNITRQITPTRADTFAGVRTGNVIEILIDNLSYNQSFDTDTVIASIGIRPKHRTRFELYDSAKGSVYGYINEYNGNILISNYTANRLLYGSIVCIV